MQSFPQNTNFKIDVTHTSHCYMKTLPVLAGSVKARREEGLDLDRN